MNKLLLCLLAFGCAATARTEVVHVAPGGKPAGAGTTQAPLATIQEALDRAKPGDTVRVAAGVYRERVVFKNGGEHSKPVTLQGEPGAVLDGSEPVSLDWKPAPDVAPGAFRATVAFPVFTVVADNKIVAMLREDRVEPGKAAKGAEWEWPKLFRSGVGPSGWDGVKALALYFKKKNELLVRFQNDRRDAVPGQNR